MEAEDRGGVCGGINAEMLSAEWPPLVLSVDGVLTFDLGD